MRLVAEVNGQRQEFPIRRRQFVVGRSATCDVTILSPTVSRRHIECTVHDDGRVTMRDLETRNGTFLNDQPVTGAELQPGQDFRLGTVPMRFLAGGPPLPPVAEGQPGTVLLGREERRQLLDNAVPDSAQYVEDGEPTPVDADFAPEANLPAEIAKTADGSALPAKARVLGGRLGRPRLQLTPRLKIAIGAAAVVLIIFLAMMILTGKKPEGILSRNAFNQRYIAEAVSLYQAQKADAAIKLLKGAPSPAAVQSSPKTAKIMIDALEVDVNLQTPKGFEENREEAEQRWKELSTYPQTPPQAHDLAVERLAWIARERSSMYTYSTFLEYVGKSQWRAAMDEAGKIPAASLFRKAVDEKLPQVRETFVKEGMAEADRALATHKWDAALPLYQALAKVAGDRQAEIDRKMRECDLGQRESTQVARAAQLISSGKFEEARGLLTNIRADGPYGPRVKQLQIDMEQAKGLQGAQNAYDAGKADEALRVLEQAGQSSSPLYKRIRTVRDYDKDIDKALKDSDFTRALNVSKNIIALEPSKTNAYHVRASNMIDNWKGEANKRALQLMLEGQEAMNGRQYAKARSLFEDARRIDPAHELGKKEIRQLQSDAGMAYNAALNLHKDGNTVEALKVLHEVLARLQHDDTYYKLAVDKIKELGGKP